MDYCKTGTGLSTSICAKLGQAGVTKIYQMLQNQYQGLISIIELGLAGRLNK